MDRIARLTGFLFLFYILAAAGGGLIVASFRVSGDFSRTAANIAASDTLYRGGLIMQLAGDMTAILLGWALYILLRTVDGDLALLGLLWRLGEGFIGSMAATFRFLALGLYTGRVADVSGSSQEPLVSLASYVPRAGFPIAILFFSIGSFIFFRLLLQSGLLPKWLSWFGIVGSPLVSVLGLGLMITPSYSSALRWLWIPIAIAEIGGGLVLLARGTGRAPPGSPLNGKPGAP